MVLRREEGEENGEYLLAKDGKEIEEVTEKGTCPSITFCWFGLILLIQLHVELFKDPVEIVFSPNIGGIAFIVVNFLRAPRPCLCLCFACSLQYTNKRP